MSLALTLPASLFINGAARRPLRYTVVWLNEVSLRRVTGLGERRQLVDFVMLKYAFELGSNAGSLSRTKFWVDRYGTTGVKAYGGSGRAGLVNDAQVKGIGATQFVDPRADRAHAHGRLSLREAVKECVYSVVASELFPFGAVETLAIIALGEGIRGEGLEEQAALLVRPFSVRASHLQRATGYAEPGQEAASHSRDVQRVRDMVRLVERGRRIHFLKMFVSRLASQVAYSHLYGWFGGGVLSSNFTLTARMIDFGAACFVPSWRRSEFNSFGPAFGDEEAYSAELLRSLVFYCRKFGARSPPSFDELTELFRACYDRSVISAATMWLQPRHPAPLSSAKTACMTEFHRLFDLAQAAKCDVQARKFETESVYMASEFLGAAKPRAASWLEVAGIEKAPLARLDSTLAQTAGGSSLALEPLVEQVLKELRAGRKPTHYDGPTKTF